MVPEITKSDAQIIWLTIIKLSIIKNINFAQHLEMKQQEVKTN